MTIRLLLAVFFFCVLSASGRAETESEKLRVPLRLYQLPNPKDSGIGTKAQIAVLKEFRRLHPEIEISQFSGISIPGIGNESKLMMAIAGGSAPDVMVMNMRMSDTYIQQGFIVPLDKYIRRDYPGGVPEYLKTIPSPAVPAIFREGPAIGDEEAGKHLWALGGSFSVRVLCWRKDLFIKAGLDPERPPQNWEELYDYAKKLTNPAIGQYGMLMMSGMQAAWDFMAFLWSAGGEAVMQNEKGEWFAAYGTREGAIALDMYLKLNSEEWRDPYGNIQYGYSSRNAVESGANEWALWGSGKLGMMVTYLRSETMGAGTDPTLLGMAPFPKGPTGLSGTELNFNLYGIFSNIENRRNSEGKLVDAERIREAAWQYIKFITSKEARRITASVFVENGMGNLLSPEILREFGYEEYLKHIPAEYETLFKEALKNGKPEPFGRNCQMIYVFMTHPIDKAMQMIRDGTLPPDGEKRLEILEKLLRDSARDTTTYMIGHISPEERRARNTVAFFVLVFFLMFFCFVLYRIWKIFTPDKFDGMKRGWEWRRNWPAYLIMLPALASLLIWTYCPMVSGSVQMFQDYRIAGGSTWSGLNNMADVLYSADWWKSVWNTLRYMILILGLGFFAPIILAILLHEVSHMKIFYRTVFYLPAVMSGMVVIYMWRLFYNAGPTGIMNQMLGQLCSLFGLTFHPVAWLEDANWAMFACVLPMIWAGAGPGCLIYLAALKGIPEEMYEAADIDGANFFQKIWHVMFPSLKALIIINFVGAFIAAAQSGGMILVMTFGRAETEVAELHIFKEAYTNLRFGMAISMAWILGIVILLFTIYQLKKLSNMEFKTTGK